MSTFYRGRIYLQCDSPGCEKLLILAGRWPEIAVPDHMDLSTGQLPSTRESKQGPITWKPWSLYKLILEMTSHYLAASFFFLAALRHMDFLGQGPDPSRSCDLCCSCSNFFVTHSAGLGIESVSWCYRAAANLNTPLAASFLFEGSHQL